MVVIQSTIEELNKLINSKLTAEELNDIALKYGLDMKVDNGIVSIETTSDRVDILTSRSLSFLISQILGKKTQIDEKFDKINLNVKVEAKKRNKIILVLLELKENDEKIVEEITQMTDKLSDVVGRRRKFAGVGAFDFDKISFPIYYREVDDIKFVPLGKDKVLTLKEILEETYQGKNYNFNEFYAWFDSNNEVIALVPIINAAKFSIDKNTKRILFEISGDSEEVVNNIGKILLFNAQLFGKVKLVKGFEPKLENRELSITEEDVKELLGIEINREKIIKTLNNFGFKVKSGKEITVSVPFYRLDVMSKVDIIDEILRAIGPNNIPEEKPKSFNIGKYLPEHNYIEAIRKTMFSLGFQEINTSVLSSKFYQEDITNENGIKTLAGDYVRTHLYPELIRFLQINKEKGKPYYFFDIGYVLQRDEALDVKYKNKLMLSFLIADEKQNVGYGLAAIREILLNIFNMNFSVKEENIPNFIQGRSGYIIVNNKNIGLIGELHPSMLKTLSIYMPITIAEINLDSLYASL